MNEASTYWKRPVPVQVMRWEGGAANATPIIDWILDNGGTARYHEAVEQEAWTDDAGILMGHPASPEYIAIDTLEGTMRADVGDWIVCGVEGEFYPVKPHIFAKTYQNDNGLDEADLTQRKLRNMALDAVRQAQHEDVRTNTGKGHLQLAQIFATLAMTAKLEPTRLYATPAEEAPGA